MGEQMKRWITITVPFTERALQFGADERGWWRAYDGSMAITASRERREVRVELNDVYAEVERAVWPSEPATDYATKLAEIEATHAAVAEDDAQAGSVAHADRGWLLAQLRAASAALTAAGIPDDGRPVAERIPHLMAVAFFEGGIATVRSISAELPRDGVAGIALRRILKRMEANHPGLCGTRSRTPGEPEALQSGHREGPPSPIAPEPPPAVTGSTPVWPLVMADVEALGFEDPVRGLLLADMRERDAFGRAKYGTPLTADNGRSHLRDAYQEVLDEVVYLRAEIERGDPTGVARELYVEALQHATRLRKAIADNADPLAKKGATS